MMTTNQINELRKLLSEATPGPWKITTDMSANGRHRRAIVHTDRMVADCSSVNLHRTHDRYPLDGRNAALIAAAVNALPELLAEREKLRAALQKAHNVGKLVNRDIFNDDLDRRAICSMVTESNSVCRAALAETEGK